MEQILGTSNVPYLNPTGARKVPATNLLETRLVAGSRLGAGVCAAIPEVCLPGQSDGKTAAKVEPPRKRKRTLKKNKPNSKTHNMRLLWCGMSTLGANTKTDDIIEPSEDEEDDYKKDMS